MCGFGKSELWNLGSLIVPLKAITSITCIQGVGKNVGKALRGFVTAHAFGLVFTKGVLMFHNILNILRIELHLKKIECKRTVENLQKGS